MLNLNNLVLAKRIRDFLMKNKIQVMHFVPGRIRLKLPDCLDHAKLDRFMQELESEENIDSVSFTPETRSLLVQYNETVVNDLQLMDTWLKKVETINFLQTC